MSRRQYQHHEPAIVHLVQHPVGSNAEKQGLGRPSSALAPPGPGSSTGQAMDQTAQLGTLEHLQLAAVRRPQTVPVRRSGQSPLRWAQRLRAGIPRAARISARGTSGPGSARAAVAAARSSAPSPAPIASRTCG